MRIARHISELIGNTPLVELNSIVPEGAGRVVAKVEYLNPGGSVKDRIAVKMIDAAEASGELGPGGTIVEPTSGNTGVGLALVAQQRGYKCIFVCPDKVSEDKQNVLLAYGAEVVVCPTAVPPEHPDSYYSVSDRLVREIDGAWKPDQYSNPANPASHYETTGPEIWADTDGRVDVFVAGMGTGGTISGCGRYFREKKQNLKIVGVDPIGSLYYEYVKTGRMTKPFSYYVEGIGEDFLPGTMNLKIIDEIIRVDDKECFLMTRRLAREEAIYCGGSAGAAVAGAIKYSERSKKKENILVLLPDSAQKYLSKIFDDKWMREGGFLDEEDPLGTVADLMLAKRQRELITAQKGDKIKKVVGEMKEYSISQVPVLDGKRLCGIISEVDLLNHLVGEGKMDDVIDPLIEADYSTVTPVTKVKLLKNVFNDAKVVCVQDGEDLIGVITKIDLIDYLATRRAA